MNTPLPLRYDHTDNSRIPLDVRLQPSSSVVLMNCFCVGFRISMLSRDRYHYALIIADDHESLLGGVAREMDAIRAQSAEMSIQKIEVVYVRNLQTLDTEYFDRADLAEIQDKTRETLRKRDDHHFVVFGLLGEETTAFLDVHTSDALSALRLSKMECAKLHPKKFSLLEVRHAHPVAFEFDALSERTFSRLRCLDDPAVPGSTCLN